MRIVLQRVIRACVRIRGREEVVAQIGQGLLLLVASGANERAGEPKRLAEKIYGLRIFEDADGKMNIALPEAGGEILVVPQFTLYGDVRRGRRPSWAAASAPEIAFDQVEKFALELERLGARVSRGAFREHMEVDFVNDGPVTLVLDGEQLPS